MNRWVPKGWSIKIMEGSSRRGLNSEFWSHFQQDTLFSPCPCTNIMYCDGIVVPQTFWKSCEVIVTRLTQMGLENTTVVLLWTETFTPHNYNYIFHPLQLMHLCCLGHRIKLISSYYTILFLYSINLILTTRQWNFYLHVHYYFQSVEKIVMDDKLFHTNRTCKMNIRSWWHIPQLQWLGFNYDERNNITKIKEYIDFIVPKLVYVRIVIILLFYWQYRMVMIFHGW